MNNKIGFNVLGLLCSVVGILLLFRGTELLLGLALSIFGAIIYGGLPKGKIFSKLLKMSPRTLTISVALVVFFIKYFGQELATRTIFAAIVGVFIIEKFIIAGLLKLLKD